LSTGNNCLDEFIYKTQQNSRGPIDWLDWIDYKQFSDITFLAEGGFANVYLAKWKEGPPLQYQCWYVSIGRKRNRNTKVVLKSLKNSKNMTKEFLNELETHHKCLSESDNSLKCYGVTFIPEQNEYALVLKYAQNGNIRQYIQNENENLTWYRRVELLEGIVDNLKHIHSKNFIHGDLHSGNVLKGKLVLEVRRIRNRGSAWINKDIDKDELAASTRELNKTDVRKQNLHPGAIYTSRLIPCLSNTSTVHSDDDLFAS
ncbi:4393_t:CDS:2, partial [Ambispora leptoticha]